MPDLPMVAVEEIELAAEELDVACAAAVFLRHGC